MAAAARRSPATGRQPGVPDSEREKASAQDNRHPHRRGRRRHGDQRRRAGCGKHHPQTITLKATTVSLTCIPVPGQKPGPEVPGDQCVFSENLTRNGAPYGHNAIHCVVATTNDLVCTAAWMLPDGQITVAGDAGSTTGTRKLLPVLGGTGAYQDASGQVTIINTSSSTSTVTFHLLPASH